MNRSDCYSPLEVPRRWIVKSPRRQRAATSSFCSSKAAVRYKGTSFRSLLSCIIPAKTLTAICSHTDEDEAETPLIFWVDEKYPNSVKKKETIIDPFEAKESSSVSFQIVGTIRCVATLDTIVENEEQEQASFDPKTKTSAAGPEKGFEVSPASIKIVGSFDCTSLHLVPVKLFPGENADSDDVFNESGCRDEEDGFETISFERVNFEEDSLDVSVSGAATGMNELNISEDESLEMWIDSESTMNGFTKAESFQSHDWDDETD
jgi:hypothetical protein